MLGCQRERQAEMQRRKNEQVIVTNLAKLAGIVCVFMLITFLIIGG